MTKLLTGNEVAYEIKENIKERVSKLVESGVRPTLAIITRISDIRDPNEAYMKSIMKQANEVGINIYQFKYETEQGLINSIKDANYLPWVHGCIIMCPLPEGIDESILNELDVKKDVDGITKESLANIFVNGSEGYAPATAEACIRILDYYDIPIEGYNAIIVGRSLVVGKPLAMMLLNRNASVTMCHSNTVDINSCMHKADIVISAAGNTGIYDKDSFNPWHTVIDVGINFNGSGKMCGDVDFAEVSEIVDAITPVPGGVGSVTTAVLLEHVVDAAEKASKHV